MIHNRAVNELLLAGHEAEARELDQWRNVDGNKGGWDGWLRKKWPHLVALIWPGIAPK